MTETDKAVRDECKARGLTFRPWEIRPWDVQLNSRNPYPPTTAGAISFPKAQKLRRRLLDEMANDHSSAD